jgi:hypothetical protein
MTTPAAHTSLKAAKAWLRERVDEGERCPCCTQFAKVYKRTISSSQAYALISMYKTAGYDFVHFPTLLNKGKRYRANDETKLQYWELIEEEFAVRPDGGRSGYWRITPKGVEFLMRRITVPKFARVYDNRCLGYLGPEVTIDDALRNRFNYDEMMAA